MNSQANATAPQNEPALLVLARRTEATTRKAMLAKERPALEGELASYDAEEAVDQLALNGDLAGQQVSLTTIRLQRIELMLNRKVDKIAKGRDRRGLNTSLTQVRFPDNQVLARRHLELAKKNRRVATEVASESEKLKALRGELDELVRNFELTKQKVESVGLPASVGAVLRKQRKMLPDIVVHRAKLRNRQSRIDAAQLTLYDLQDERARLSDVEEYLEEHVAHTQASRGGRDQRVDVSKEARELLARKTQYLDPLIRSQTSLFDTLAEHSITEQQLIQLSKEFAEYIDERVLWIRSEPRLSSHFDVTDDLSWLLREGNWSSFGRRIIADVAKHPHWYLLCGVLLVGLTRYAARMRKQIHDIGLQVQRNSFSQFGPTLQAAALTVAISLIWPLVIAFIGWRVYVSSDADDFVLGLSNGIFTVAAGFLFLELLRQICRPNGLAHAHFDCPESAARLMRRSMRLLMAFGLPLMLFIALVQASHQGQRVSSLERTVFIAGTLLLTLVMARTLHPRRGIFHFYLALHPDGWSSRLRHVLVQPGPWHGRSPWRAWRIQAITTLPSSWPGECTSASCGAASLLLLYGFLRRLLMVHRRRLSIEQARHRRAMMAAAETDASLDANDVGPTEDSLVDLTVQTSQTRRLVATLLLGTVFVGTWFVWVDVLPALEFLERWPIWESTAQITETVTGADGDLRTQTRDVITPITIADLIFAVLIAVIAMVAARNLPGLLEISVLQRLPLEAVPFDMRSLRCAVMQLCWLA